MQKKAFRIYSQKLSVPVDLIDYANANNFIKPLGVYLLLKMASAGKIHGSSLTYAEINKSLGFNTNRTCKKHLQSLLESAWIVYNPKSGIYFIQGFERLRSKLNLTKRRAVTLYLKDLKALKAFIAGAIISTNIKKQQYVALVKTSKRKRFVSKIEGETNTNLMRCLSSDYFGISNMKIGKLLNCKQTEAYRRKSAAVNAGYITSKQRYKLLAELPKADMNFRKAFSDSCNLNPARIKCSNWDGQIMVFYQLYNEIIAHMNFTNRKGICKAEKGC